MNASTTPVVNLSTDVDTGSNQVYDQMNKCITQVVSYPVETDICFNQVSAQMNECIMQASSFPQDTGTTCDQVSNHIRVHQASIRPDTSVSHRMCIPQAMDLTIGGTGP
mmetsp:Transcript_148878/g.459842  ORF Transcript_148878/g.459842 Transcript_148878/m.459842 type:complete len:109 (+) Transcript_148878:266-592(+)